MSKTIEELAKQYAAHQTDEQGYGSMEAWKQDVAIYYDDAKEVLSWLFAKPITSRLTDAEKKAIRLMHADTFPNDIDQSLTGKCIMYSLEEIFGRDFFKDNYK